MPKIVNSDEVKQYILTQSLAVFLEKGYYQTTISDIAQRCQMGRTTLYHYYKNKEALFESMVNDVLDTLQQDLATLIHPSDHPFFDDVSKIVTKWDAELNHNNIIILLIELKLLVWREDGEMFVRLRHKLAELSRYCRKIARIKINTSLMSQKDRLQLSKYHLVHALLYHNSLGEEVFSEYLQSVITTIASSS